MRLREHSPGSTSAISQDDLGASGRAGLLASGGSAVSKVRQSIMQGASHPGARHSRDPRPVGDRSYTAQCARNVVEFLSFRSFPRLLSQEKFLRDPSTKEFFDVFKFIINLLDPQLEIDGAIEHEVPLIMRRLHYPVEVNKSKLQAISGPTTWPQLLAMLDWLVRLVQMQEELVQPVASCQLALPGIDSDVAEGDHNLLRTIQDNYCQYLAGSSEDSHVERLQEVYQERIRALQDEIYRIEEQHTEMAQRLRDFDLEHDRLLEIQSAPKQLEMEAERLRGLLQNHCANQKRMEDDIASANEEEKALLQDLEALRASEQQLQSQVDNQPYSKKDIERLKSERDQMRKMRDALQAESEKIEQDVWELGLKDERVAEDVGRLLRKINSAAEAIGRGCADMDCGVGDHDLAVHVDLREGTDVLTAVDFREKHAAAQAIFAAHVQTLQAEETALNDVVEKQRVAQEQVSAKEAECRRLKSHREDLAKTRDDFRVSSTAQLDDAQRTVENLETAVQAAAKDITGPSIRDTAEVDELRMTLDAVRTRRADEVSQIREQNRRSKERLQEHKEKVQKELADYSATMTSFYTEVETAAAQCGEQMDARVPARLRQAHAGGS